MKRADSEESSQEKIIRAALELFVRKGYHGTSVNDVMNKVGLTKGSLCARFKSKREILALIIERYRVKGTDELIPFVNEGENDALDKLHRCITFGAKLASAHENLCVFLTFLSTELEPDFEPMLRRVYQGYRKHVGEIIRQGIDEGTVDKETDSDPAALVFMALHDGVLHQWGLNRNLIDAGEYVRTFRKIFFHGLAKR